MLRRHLRQIGAAGLLFGSLLGPSAVAQTPEAAPETQTVDILAAQRDGQIALSVRGQGEDRVKFSIRNPGKSRLNVVLPPGLVAASGTGQGAFQSMGLGTPTTTPGSFGQFRPATPESGFRSVGTDAPLGPGIDVPAGQSVEFTVPSVCLNYGIRTPNNRDQFRLVTVDDYTPDVRVRKALRSLSTLGTSQSVAQAVMWHVCNGLSFDQLASQSVRRFNIHEVTLAARFVEAVDGSSQSSDVLDPSSLSRSRILVSVRGEGGSYADAKRLTSELEGQRILGLPVSVVDEPRDAMPSTLHLTITLAGDAGKTSGRVTVRNAMIGRGWDQLGIAPLKDEADLSSLTGTTLAEAVDRAVASTFVTVKASRRSADTTTLRIENRLPLTIAHVVVRTGRSSDSPKVGLPALGISPGRAALAKVEGGNGFVERVELNGL